MTYRTAIFSAATWGITGSRTMCWGLAIAAAVSAAVVVVGPRSPESAAAPPPPVVHAPPLDGTYRQDIDGANITRNGRPTAGGNDMTPYWFGFRSACTPAGCVASASELDPKNLSLPVQSPSASFVLQWIGHQWQSGYTSNNDCSGPIGDAKDKTSTVWSITPQPDGTFRGTRTYTTLSDECGDEGEVLAQPFTLTRAGPPPPAGIADPPTAVAGQPPPPPPSPQLPPAGGADPDAAVIFDGQKLSTSSYPPTCAWVHGKAVISVDAPNNKILVLITGLTANDLETLDIDIGNQHWMSSSRGSDSTSASVTQKGKKSYTVTGMASSYDGTYRNLFKSYRIDVICP